MIRDFVTILYGEEVVIILVAAAFFLGLSIGYFLSLKFSEKFFETAFLTIVFLHLTFPFSCRLLAAGFAIIGLSALNGETVTITIEQFTGRTSIS